MSAGRVLWVIFIVVLSSIAWAILGQSVSRRTDQANQKLRAQVEGLWGTPLAQSAPRFTATWETGQGKKRTTSRTEVRADRNTVRADLKLDLRRKGLLWYRCYRVVFDGEYVVTNPRDGDANLSASMQLPTANAVYENFRFDLGDKPALPTGNTITTAIALRAGQQTRLKVHYETRGLESWQYAFGSGTAGATPAPPGEYGRPGAPYYPPGENGAIANVRNLDLVVTTDFDRVNFPPRTISPSTNDAVQGKGRKLTWKFGNLISGFAAGVEMPEKLDAGPIASRIAFFAPVGLLFFVSVLVIIGAMQDRNLHPMHYFFLASAFFSFHLLFAYLADHLALNVAFLISAGVSLLLVGSYVGRALGAGFTFKVILPSQLLFLVLFSYAFFFQGYTGLTITIASIITLFVLMQVTARVDWEAKFAKNRPPRPSGPMPPPPTAGVPPNVGGPPTANTGAPPSS